MHPTSSIRVSHQKSRLKLVSALALGLAALSACATPPGDHVLTPLTPDSLASATTLAGDGGAWPQTAWWKGFNDPQLNALVDEALAKSPDLMAVQARFDKARSVNDQVRAAMDADLTLNASTAETKQSYNMGFPPAFRDFVPQGYQNMTRLALDADYDLDLWGKSRAATKAAVGSARAAELDTQVARTDIAVAVVRAYVELDRLYAQRDDLSDLKLGADIKTELTQARIDHNLDPQDAVLATKDDQAQLTGRLAAIDSMIHMQGGLIAALAGAGPDRALAITRPQLAPAEISTLPADVRLGLLSRRPDVQAALLRVEAQAQALKYVRADYYPNLKLNAYFGVQALSKGGFENLFESGSDIGSIGPALSLPLFHQKRLDAAYHGYEADYDAAVAAYDKTLIGALQQVADAAGRSEGIAAELKAGEDRIALAEQGYQLSKARFAKGLATKMDVLTAHARVIAVESAQADLKAQAYNTRIAFVAALGGGYTTPSSSGE